MGKSKQSTFSLINKFSFAQNSNVKLAVLTSVLGLTLFFTIAFFSPFKDALLSMLFPKPSSFATIYTSSDLIKNGSFESDLSPWVLILSSPAQIELTRSTETKVDGNFSANINIKENLPNSWYGQIRQNNLSIVAGRVYTLTFWAKANKNLTTNCVLQLSNSPYKVIFNYSARLTNKWRKYKFTFRAPTTFDNVMIGFNLQNIKSNIWLDNISFVSR